MGMVSYGSTEADYWYKKLIRNNMPFEIIRLIANGSVHC
jgi:hypothetical protein